MSDTAKLLDVENISISFTVGGRELHQLECTRVTLMHRRRCVVGLDVDGQRTRPVELKHRELARSLDDLEGAERPIVDLGLTRTVSQLCGSGRTAGEGDLRFPFPATNRLRNDDSMLS